MGNNILLKKSSVTGKIPLTTDLQYGEVAINYADGKLYYKSNAGSVGILNPTESDNFKTIAVSGQSNVVADNPTATLTLSPSVGIDITTNATTDTITFAHSDTSTVGNINSDNGAGTVLQDISLTFDTFGHVTAASVGTVNLDSRYLQAESDTLNTVTTRGATTSNAITVGGITVNGNATITGDISGADSFTFDTTATEADGIAKVYWNNSLGVLRVGLGGGNVAVDVPKTQVAFVTNAEVTSLAKGEVVYLFGAQGDRPTVKRAANGSDTTSSRTFGVVAEAIAAGQTGYIITSGVCEGLSLGAYTPGDILWLGSSPGTFTTTKPVAPAHGVFVGVVQRANPGNGQLYVKIQNGYELNEIHDVLISSVATNDSLFYDGAASVWKNTPPATARTNLGLGTIATQNASSVTITGGTINSTSVGATTPSTGAFTTLSTTGNATIGGNLTVQGTTTTISATNLAISDNMIYLNNGATNTNPDIGFAANYNDGSYRHTGFFRDATDGYWKVFKNYTPEPDASIYIDTSHASFALADIQAANFRGALVGNADTATVLQTARTINGVSFNGSANITITSNTTNALTLGDGLSGTSFNGSAAVTAAVDSSIARRADVTYIGTTSVALNRASAALALTGISSVTAPTDLTLNTGLTVTSGGNVGIKTASPQSTLAVQFVDNSTVSIGLQHPNSAKLMQIGWNDTDYTYINTFNGSRALVLQNTGGNVGIGTTTPAASLEVIGSNASDSVQLGTIGNDHIVGGRTNGSFGITTKSTSNGNMILTANAAMYLRSGGANDRVHITSGGDVGIGTTGPSVKLHIYGADQRMQIQSSTDSASLTLGQWDTVNNRIESYTRKLFITSYTGGISLGASGSEHVHVSTQGRLGVGTTSPGSKLAVTGTEANTLALDVVANATSNQSFGGRIYAGTTANDYALNIRNVADSATYFYVRGDGNVGIGTSSPGSKLEVLAANTYAAIRSGSASAYTFLSVGRTSSEIEIGASAATDQFFTGSAAGDAIIKAPGGKLHIGSGSSSPSITISVTNSVGIGTASPSQTLHVAGSARITGALYDSSNSAGTSGQVLTSTGSGTAWSSSGASITGSGTTNYVAKFTGSTALGSSVIYDDGTRVGIGTTGPVDRVDITGTTSGYPAGRVLFGDGGGYSPYMKFHKWTGTSSNYYQTTIANSISVGGALEFWTGTGGQNTIGNDAQSLRMVILANTGNVGIGTSSPSVKLHVVGDARIGTNGQRISLYDDGNAHIESTSAVLWINSSDGSGVYINNQNNGNVILTNATGRVGIGTTSPTQKLELDGNIKLTNGGYVYGDGTNSYLRLSNAAGSYLKYGGTGIAALAASVQIAATSEEIRIVNDNGKIWLAANGKVGIGTDTPGGNLEVNHTANQGATALILRCNNSGANGAIRWQNSGGVNTAGIGTNFNVSDSGALEFLNGTTTNVIFRSSGDVGIGTTTPSQKLDVQGNIAVGPDTVYSYSTITTTATTANQVITAVSSTTYRTAKFIIQATDATGGKYQSQEILAVHNGSTAAHTEYTAINVGGAVATYDVDISGGTLRLLCTPLSSNSTVFKVQMTLIKS